MNSSRPPGLSTRAISASAAETSATEHSTYVTTTVSKLASSNGSDGNPARARLTMPLPGRSAPRRGGAEVIEHVRAGVGQHQLGHRLGYQGKFAPLPAPISSVAPCAWANSRSRVRA